MLAALFYLATVTVLMLITVTLVRQHRTVNAPRFLKLTKFANFISAALVSTDSVAQDSGVAAVSEPWVESESTEVPATQSSERSSPYRSDFVILKVLAHPDRPYMGYELHQTLLELGLRFGEMNLFHRYAQGERGKILFSLAAATTSGEFNLEDLGLLQCKTLLFFIQLDAKRGLMTRFNLMLDTARQLVEELGGGIYDDCSQPIGSEVLQRLREKICRAEPSNRYNSDFLDNLD